VGIPADLDAFDELLEKHWALDAWKFPGFKGKKTMIFVFFCSNKEITMKKLPFGDFFSNHFLKI